MSFIYQTILTDQNLLAQELEAAISTFVPQTQKIAWQFFNLNEKLKIEAVRQLQAQILQFHQPETLIYFVLNLNQAQLVIQNALLKIIEEPPSGINFILLSSSPESLLPTITSRCTFLSLDEKKAPLNLDTLNSFWQFSAWQKIAKSTLALSLIKDFELQYKQLAEENNFTKNDFAGQLFQQFLLNLVIILDQRKFSAFNLTLEQLLKIINLTQQSLIYLNNNVSPKNVFYYLTLNS